MKILKKNWLKYFILAFLFTCISYLYQRYGWAYSACSSDCTYEWSLFSDNVQYPIQVAGLPIPYAFNNETNSLMDIISDVQFSWSIFLFDVLLWILIFTVLMYWRKKCQGNHCVENNDRHTRNPVTQAK